MNSYAERFICNAPETDEAKARFRRLKLFMHLTGLVEVVNRPTFVDKIPSQFAQRCSYWTDTVHHFCLCEPDDAGQTVPEISGLVFEEIEAIFAPFGGHWTQRLDSQPNTRSFLVCDQKDKAVLTSISFGLFEGYLNSPSWNSVK